MPPVQHLWGRLSSLSPYLSCQLHSPAFHNPLDISRCHCLPVAQLKKSVFTFSLSIVSPSKSSSNIAMAKNIKASRLAGSTSHKRRSSKPSFKGNSQSRSNAKGLKVRDRKDVEDMNELKNISELQSHLGTSTTTKKKQTPVKVSRNNEAEDSS